MLSNHTPLPSYAPLPWANAKATSSWLTRALTRANGWLPPDSLVSPLGARSASQGRPRSKIRLPRHAKRLSHEFFRTVHTPAGDDDGLDRLGHSFRHSKLFASACKRSTGGGLSRHPGASELSGRESRYGG